MIVDPVDVLKKTSTLLVPTSTYAATSSVAPIPTVVPDVPEYELIGRTGTRTLWVGFVVMLITFLVYTGLSYRVPVAKRLYYSLTSIVALVATLTYFAMASGHGTSLHRRVIHEVHKHVPDTHHVVFRQVFFARYIDWAITSPILLLELGFLAGLSGGRILNLIVADLVFVLTGLFSAYGGQDTPQKWGWYAIAVISWLVVVGNLFVGGRSAATTRSNALGSFFTSIATFFVLLWTAYPVIWAVADGARILTVSQESIAYLVLDILTKVVLGSWIIIGYSNLPESQVELGGFWTYGLYSDGRIRIDDDEGA